MKLISLLEIRRLASRRSAEMTENAEGSWAAGPRSLKCNSFITFSLSLRLGALPLRTFTCPVPCIPSSGSLVCSTSPASFRSPSILPVIFPRPSRNAARRSAMSIPLIRASELKRGLCPAKLKERSPAALPPYLGAYVVRLDPAEAQKTRVPGALGGDGGRKTMGERAEVPLVQYAGNV